LGNQNGTRRKEKKTERKESIDLCYAIALSERGKGQMDEIDLTTFILSTERERDKR
jgi:hypothetical protein